MSGEKFEKILAALSSIGIGAAVYTGLNNYINNILNEMHLNGSYDPHVLSLSMAIPISLGARALINYAINTYEENKRRKRYLI
ncbi:MAG: hypothetical protein QXX36_00890 [Candidatus Rehaiarchaeum fermentans]|nr:hypothetical protein [Candidatus Rehaiarchaeum fermentans]